LWMHAEERPDFFSVHDFFYFPYTGYSQSYHYKENKIQILLNNVFSSVHYMYIMENKQTFMLNIHSKSPIYNKHKIWSWIFYFFLWSWNKNKHFNKEWHYSEFFIWVVTSIGLGRNDHLELSKAWNDGAKRRWLATSKFETSVTQFRSQKSWHHWWASVLVPTCTAKLSYHRQRNSTIWISVKIFSY
jgi:hypothetical protein